MWRCAAVDVHPVLQGSYKMLPVAVLGFIHMALIVLSILLEIGLGMRLLIFISAKHVETVIRLISAFAWCAGLTSARVSQ